MNTHKLKLAALLFAFYALWTPQSSEAYFTTDQQAYKLTDTTALFTITYRFGLEKRDVYMPIGALRDSADADALILTYQLLSDNKPIDNSIINGLVLTKDTNVTIINNTYHVPAGSSATFTLYVLPTLTDTAATNDDLSVLVTQLPFVMKTDELTIDAHLNPSELQYYHTPAITF